MKDLQIAKEQLYSGGYTCVLCKGTQTRTSAFRGVRPLVAWLQSSEDFRGYSAADKVVGKATAFLYVLLGVRSVHACVISESALVVLNAHGIIASYDMLVPHIINRAGDGICPFEAAVTPCSTPDEAYLAICRKMKEMGISV